MLSNLLSENKIASYREGHVINDIVCNVGCCVPYEDYEEIFRYIELICTDGSRLYLYDNQTGFSRFEEDFHKRRFTSFHEFWTTDVLADEKRGLFTFKYYIRHTADSYLVENVANALQLLHTVNRLPDRITSFHNYDRTVDYHEFS